MYVYNLIFSRCIGSDQPSLDQDNFWQERIDRIERIEKMGHVFNYLNDNNASGLDFFMRIKFLDYIFITIYQCSLLVLQENHL